MLFVDGYASLGGWAFERYLSRNEGEEGEVSSDTYAGTWVELIAALSNDDLTGLNDLAAISLDASVLRLGVSSVS